MSDRLQANQQLNVNQQLMAPNGKTHLVMQPDGNLVLYRNDTGAALWASRTWHKPVNRAVMQGDGNFVCYDPNGHAYWASGTAGHPGAHITLQDDGNLVIYDSNMTELWATNTVENWDPFTVDTGDVHLDTGEWMHTWASMSHSGLITGRSRVWCTIDLRGFHGSVIPMLLDGDQKVIWPPNPQVSKRGAWGVDGVWIGVHDITVPWTCQADPAILAQARTLGCYQYLDPHNKLLADLKIIGEIVAVAGPIIAAAAKIF